MSNETETKEGGSAFPAIAGAAIGAGAGGVVANNIVQNDTVKKALSGDILKGKDGKALEGKALEHAESLHGRVHDALHKVEGASTKLADASALKTADVKAMTFSKSEQGFRAIADAETAFHQFEVKKLPKGVKLEGDIVKVEGEALKKLTEGEKSWVKKAATNIEKDVAKAVRSEEAFKKAGGFGGLKNLSGSGKAIVAGGAVLAAIVAGIGMNMAFGKHTSKVANEPAMEPAAGRA